MDVQKLVTLCGVFVLTVCALSQETPRSVLLPAGAGDLGFRHFGDGTRLGSWQPSQADIDSIEVNLAQISSLKPSERGDSRRIEHPFS